MRREVNKHVESFDVVSWIRVQFSAPPPKIADWRLPIADWHLTKTNLAPHRNLLGVSDIEFLETGNRQSAIANWQSADDRGRTNQTTAWPLPLRIGQRRTPHHVSSRRTTRRCDYESCRTART